MLSVIAIAATLSLTPRTEIVALMPPEFPEPGKRSVVVYRVHSKLAWKEAVVSWNVKSGESAAVTVRTRLVTKDRVSKDYTYATWSLNQAAFPRTSVKDQGDADADIDTDIVVAKGEGDLELEVELERIGESKLEFTGLWVSLATGTPSAPEFDVRAKRVRSKVWGRLIEVPKRAQMNYPNGGVICSPTAVSMVLAHWAKQGTGLDHDVPAVVDGVYDPAWKGTGNWAFNVAFAGAQPGMQALVARLEGIGEAEKLIEKGIPVITSVSYALLKGKPKRESGDGHLVVLIGFTEAGDPIFNDPGRNYVRQVYGREDFLRAWASSGNTAYVISPSKVEVPLPITNRAKPVPYATSR